MPFHIQHVAVFSTKVQNLISLSSGEVYIPYIYQSKTQYSGVYGMIELLIADNVPFNNKVIMY